MNNLLFPFQTTDKIAMTSICFFNATQFWGGGEKWHFDTALYLSSRGHRVFFIAHPYGELYKRIAGTDINPVSMTISNLSFFNLFKIRKLVNFFRAEHIRTVVFNGSSEVKIGALAARIAGVKARVYRRGLAVPVKNTALNRFIYEKLITHFLTNSKATAQILFKYLSVQSAAAKVRTIYNGIDPQKFSFPSGNCVPDRIKRPIILGTVGRLEKEKGHSYLIETASQLKKCGLDFQLLIAGEGPLRQSLEAQIREHSVQDAVQLIGFKKDVSTFLQKIDIFVFPSLWEGFGYAIAEAMAAGLPVIAFETSSVPEIIEQGVTGYMVPVGNLELLTEKILLLAENPNISKTMGQNGKKRVRRFFDQAIQLAILENYLCKEVLNNNGADSDIGATDPEFDE